MKEPRQPIPEHVPGHLKDVFPKPVIKPGIDRDILMYQAGQQSVIDYLQSHVKSPNNPQKLS